jgi:Antibiotic biosynthesis monooxygenase
MVALVEMDPTITLFEQMQDRGGPVVLINSFKVHPDEVDQLLSAWTADATLMRAQPGYISTQLHRGIGGSCVFLNYAVWESTEHFARAPPPSRTCFASLPLPASASNDRNALRSQGRLRRAAALERWYQ